MGMFLSCNGEHCNLSVFCILPCITKAFTIPTACLFIICILV